MRALILLLALLPTLCLPLAAAPAPKSKADPASVAIGDPHHPERLPQALQDAYAHGARTITLAPGTYFLPPLGHTVFALDSWTNTTIRAYGVTLILTDLAWTHDAFDLNHCRNVTLAGPTISQNKITFYQGRIIAVGKDSAGKDFCDWAPDAGYPVPPLDAKKFPSALNVVDARTHQFKLGVGDFYDAPMIALSSGTFRIGIGGPFGVGDTLVGRWGDAPFKVYLNGSRNCTVQDVTLVRNGFAPLREDGGGGNHYRHITWALGPPPPHATTPPLITNAADGIHMIGSYPGPDIENCVFQGLFLDDCIAIHGTFQTVQAAQGRVLTLTGGRGALTVGGPVRISDTKGFFAEAVVAGLQENSDKTTTLTLAKDLGVKELGVPVGAKLSNPLADGAGYKIVGCHLGRTRSRGILVKADRGVIRNNVIEDCGMSAISAGPEYYWGEADYVHGLRITGNTLRGNGCFGGTNAAVLVHGDGALGNRNIQIIKNQFVSNYARDLQIDWAADTIISGNRLTGPASLPPALTPQTPLTLAHCDGVRLSGNAFGHAATYKHPLVVADDHVTGLENDGSEAGGTAPFSPISFTYDAGGQPHDELRDPCIVKEGRTYYLIFTMWPFTNFTDQDLAKPDRNSSPGIRLFTSQDLKHWTPGPWLVKSSDLPASCPYKHQFWAPELHKIGGKFYLVFTGSNWLKPGNNPGGQFGYHSFLGVADTIAGPYKHISLIPDSPCDTSLLGGSGGRIYAYLPFGNIEQQELDLSRLSENIISYKGLRTKAVLSDFSDIKQTSPKYLEGPWPMQVGKRYFLFFAEAYDDGYWTGVAYADSPLGPWHKDPRGKVFEGGHLAVFTGPDGRNWFSHRGETPDAGRGRLNATPFDIDTQGKIKAP